MRLEIQEVNGKSLNLNHIDNCLNEFFDAVDKDYSEQISKARKSKKAKAMGIVANINDTMPDFITHIHFVEDDKVIIRNNLPFSKMASKVGSYKKIERGLEGYLKAKGFDCQVKVMKDESV